jgi:DNA replication protein DnaC
MNKTCQWCHLRPVAERGVICDECCRHAIAKHIPSLFLNAEIKDLPKTLQSLFNQEIKNGVYLWGTPGSGKSYAMAALAKKYIREGFKIKRIHYEMFCLELRDSYKNPDTTEKQIIENLLKCDKLFIEDVGASKKLGNEESDHSTRTLLLVLDMRIESCKPTFITSNKSVENIAQSFDDRVADRLRLFEVLAMKQDSKRH